jgi:hypothetical protein
MDIGGPSQAWPETGRSSTSVICYTALERASRLPRGRAGSSLGSLICYVAGRFVAASRSRTAGSIGNVGVVLF